MIKPVDEIPKGTRGQRETYRQRIRDDIQEAIDRGILRFEFDGDYNYKYLSQYAKEESDGILRRKLREEWEKVQEPDEHGWREYPQTYERHIRTAKKYIEIINRKGDDRNHVYCEIHPDAIGELIDAHKQYLAEREKNIAEMEKAKSMERESIKTHARNLVKLKEVLNEGCGEDQTG